MNYQEIIKTLNEIAIQAGDKIGGIFRQNKKTSNKTKLQTKGQSSKGNEESFCQR